MVLFGIPRLVAGADLFPDHQVLVIHYYYHILCSWDLHRSPEFSHVIYVPVNRALSLAMVVTTQHLLLAVHNRLCVLRSILGRRHRIVFKVQIK